MPWERTTVMEQRIAFMKQYQQRVLRGEITMSALCEEHDVSRKTGYKMVRRYEQNGWLGLVDQSRAPRPGKNWSEPDVVMLVLRTRLDFPHWGARKIVAYLRHTEPSMALPAPSVAHDWIRRAEMVEHRRRFRRFPHPGKPPVINIARANQQWSVDFKGHFRTRDRRYCYPLTVMDSFSRYLLRCEGMLSPSFEMTWRVFKRLFLEHGLPDSILSDNGSPFSSNSVKRLSKLSVRWIRLGITPRLIEPGRPQQNGNHERMHRDLNVVCKQPAATCSKQQPIFDAFHHEHNNLRPHDALAQETPSSLYTSSTRAYPNKLPEIEYPAHFGVRRVRSSGEIRWDGQWFFLSDALIGEPVGFEPISDQTSIVHFGPLELGYYSGRQRKLYLDKNRPDGKAEK